MNRVRVVAGSKLIALFIALWMANNVLPYETTVMLMYIGAFGASVVYLISNRIKIREFIKAWPSSFVYTVVVFYLSKLMAEKTINSTMVLRSNT